MGDLRGLSSSSNWPGGMQHFPLTREPNWGTYPPGWLLTWALGSTGFLLRPPSGGCFLHSSIFNGRVGRGWLGTPGNGCLWLVLQELLPVGYTTQDGIIGEGDIRPPLLPSTPGCSPPKGVVGPG